MRRELNAGGHGLTPRNYMVPIVIEQVPGGERSYDLFSRLLKERIVMINGEIYDSMADVVVAQLLFLDNQDSSAQIDMYINSPGGSVTAGFAIYDTMRSIASPVSTTCQGQAASMGAFLLAAGEKGMRFAQPNATIMLHQASAGASGNIQDMRVTMNQLNRMNDRLIEELATNCGHTIEEITSHMQRDFWLSAQEAMEYGVVDHITPSKKKISP